MSHSSAPRRPPAVCAALLAIATALGGCSTQEGLELVVDNVSGRPALVAIHDGVARDEDDVMDLLIVGQKAVPPGEEEHFFLPMPDEEGWTLSIDGHLVYDSTRNAAARGALWVEVRSGGLHEVRALEDAPVPSRSGSAPPGG